MFAEYASLRMGQHSVGQLLLTLPVHSHHLHLVHCVPNKLEPICRGKSAQQDLDACAAHLCIGIRIQFQTVQATGQDFWPPLEPG